jgi:Uma2 family endonuclease
MIARPTPFRLTVPRYERMIEVGILDENDRVELIRGQLVAKMSIGDEHAACVKRLNRQLTISAGVRAIVGVQDPVRLADSVPEPDVSLLQPRADFYASGSPTPADVFLIVEVADSSLDYDRNGKGPLYAENGIAEFWIANLIDRCLEVHRQPRPDGTYADVRTLRPGDTADIAALPGVSVAVSDIL